MKLKFLIVMLLFNIPFYGQVKGSNYLYELKASVTQEIDSLKSLNTNEKLYCVNKVFEFLFKDKRVINELPYFGIEFEELVNNESKEIKCTYSFGTQASLTTKSIIITKDLELVVNFNYLNDYPKNHLSIFDVNNKNDLVPNKILINKIIELIGQEYYNFIINSSFQNQKTQKSFFIEEYTKIYYNWDKSVLIIFEINKKEFYVVVKNRSEFIKFSESNEYPTDVLDIINKWNDNSLFK